MKRSFFQAAVMSILLYGCTTWTLTKRLEKKFDGNYTRMLRAIKWFQILLFNICYSNYQAFWCNIDNVRIAVWFQIIIIIIIMSCRQHGYPWHSLARHISLSYIAFGRSSGLHPVSSHSCCMYVRAGCPAFAWPYAGSIGVHHWWVRSCFSSSVLRVWFV